ncbi:hypothetical protein D3C74_365300 [compost metagenome]
MFDQLAFPVIGVAQTLEHMCARRQLQQQTDFGRSRLHKEAVFKILQHDVVLLQGVIERLDIRTHLLGPAVWQRSCSQEVHQMNIWLAVQNIKTFDPLTVGSIAVIFLCPGIICNELGRQQSFFELMSLLYQQLRKSLALGELLIRGVAGNYRADAASFLHITFLRQLLDRAADCHFADPELLFELRLGRNDAAQRIDAVQNPVFEDFLDLLI